MSDVVKFPGERVFPNTVGGHEVWKQDDPQQEMVWAVCPYTRMHLDETRCHHCPPWEQDEDYGEMRRGCYGIAAEVCRIVFAMQARAKLEQQK